MKRILILGGGTAGTLMVNHLSRRLDVKDYSVTVVDVNPRHYYQPGFLFIPFDIYSEKDVVKPKEDFYPKGVSFVRKEVEVVEPKENRVRLKNGGVLPYDILIIATGSRIVPSETQGLLGEGWRRNIFDFYTLEGSLALAGYLKTWKGGKLVVHVKEMPIKCPVAPLEFSFLADGWFTDRKMRSAVDITYVTPLSGAFTKPVASKVLGTLLERKNIHLVPDFDAEKVDPGKNKLVSYDGREVDYDLLVTIPTNMGDEMIGRSGLGDELNFVPTNPKTLQSKAYENIFVIGDATNVPTSKAGSVAHFEAEVLTENILRAVENKALKEDYDGHANCFIESGFKKGFLIDFNYDTEPLPGKFPFPGLGPMSLLKESRMNHWGKLAFKWVYWNLLLKGRPIPFIHHRMSMAGKERPVLEAQAG
jgi:sulfide:quinone oxidoreductase